MQFVERKIVVVDVTRSFLESEIFSQDLYEDIIRFVASLHIRNGEFEGNRFIIKKMDHLNFMIFPEDETDDGRREISYAMSIFGHDLLEQIQLHAKKMGLSLLQV